MRGALGTATPYSDGALLVSIGVVVQDFAGDAFFFATIRSYRHKEWVDAMFLPYTVLFALAAMVSLVSFLVNGRILLLRCHSHGSASAPSPLGSGRRNSVGGVLVPANSAMSELKAKFRHVGAEGQVRYAPFRAIASALRPSPRLARRPAVGSAFCLH